MFKYNCLLIMAVLMVAPCLASIDGYDSTGFSIKFSTQTQNDFAGFGYVMTGLSFEMANVPLYFAESRDNRDYISSISFTIKQNTDGTCELSYSIVGRKRSETLIIKGMQSKEIRVVLKNTFPDILNPTGKIDSLQTIESLELLNSSKNNRNIFENSVKLLNNFLSQRKLNFDKDFYSPIREPGLRAWFYRLLGGNL